MASAATNTISHNVPPMPLSMVSTPRIRPPRIPKGTPNANTDPQPPGKVLKGKIWVQGKLRETGSRAVQQRQEIYSRRLEKALKHETLGTSIYAYNHIRTKQVVYSLTKNMDNNKMMQQLQYHGKKTVPQALRRDMWTPYFSVHFPPTEYGAHAGQNAYRQLRELSLQRQLSPPNSMITTTQEDINKLKARFDPVTLKNELKDRYVKMPVLGQRLSKKMRAKRLMDQKATSVADVAYVLKLHFNGPSPEELRKARVENFKERMAKMGRRAKSRIQKIRLLEARKRDLIKALDSQAYFMTKENGNLTLDRHAAQRIALEHNGRVDADGGVKHLASINAARKAKVVEAQLAISDVQSQIDALLVGQPLQEDIQRSDGSRPMTEGLVQDNADVHEAQETPSTTGMEASVEQEQKVKVMWADMRDGTYAQDWPKNVLHGELERFAQSRGALSRTKSIHVIGGEEGSGQATSQDEASARREFTEQNFRKREEVARALEVEAEKGNDIVQNAVQLVQRAKAKDGQHEGSFETYRERLQAQLGTARSEPETGGEQGILIRDLLEKLQAQTQSASEKLSAEERGFAYEKVEQLRGELSSQLQAREIARAEFNNHRAVILPQWWKMSRQERAGADVDTVILQAQVLLRFPGHQETRPAGAEVRRVPGARRDTASSKETEGVEVDLPRSGLLDRVRAIIWRR